LNERKVISAFIRNRQSYEEAKELLDRSDFDSITLHLIDLIGDYYDTDPNASTVDVEILTDRFARQQPSQKLTDTIKGILTTLPEVSDGNVRRELREIKAYNLGLKLSAAFTRGQTGPEVQKLLQEYLHVTEDSGGERSSGYSEWPEEFTVESLLSKSFQQEGLIQLYPKALTEHLDGGCRPGHQILVFAPTEMGKTLVVLNFVAGFTLQGLRTLYVGNEDPVADLQIRYCTNLIGRPKSDILKFPDRAQAALDKRNYKNAIFAPLAPGTFKKIRELVSKFRPHVVVLDQLRNMDVHIEGRTQALEAAATQARNLAKSMEVLVVSVSQAADSATGKRILARGDVDSSNVGIPGQMDVMIGIGATQEDEEQNRRWFSFPKNKVSGRKDPIPFVINPTTSTVIED
jgi:archaellum biogenesis ATPase FlaH